MKKWLQCIGLILFAYLLYSVGLERILHELTRMDAAYFGAALLFFVPIAFLLTLRFRLILAAYGISLSYGRCFKYFLLGQYYGFITPGKIGSF